jgi:hypothetical protein
MKFWTCLVRFGHGKFGQFNQSPSLKPQLTDHGIIQFLYVDILGRSFEHC